MQTHHTTLRHTHTQRNTVLTTTQCKSHIIAHIRTHTYTHKHTHIHTHTRARTHTHTHTYTSQMTTLNHYQHHIYAHTALQTITTYSTATQFCTSHRTHIHTPHLEHYIHKIITTDSTTTSQCKMQHVLRKSNTSAICTVAVTAGLQAM